MHIDDSLAVGHRACTVAACSMGTHSAVVGTEEAGAGTCLLRIHWQLVLHSTHLPQLC